MFGNGPCVKLDRVNVEVAFGCEGAESDLWAARKVSLPIKGFDWPRSPIRRKAAAKYVNSVK